MRICLIFMCLTVSAGASLESAYKEGEALSHSKEFEITAQDIRAYEAESQELTAKYQAECEKKGKPETSAKAHISEGDLKKKPSDPDSLEMQGLIAGSKDQIETAKTGHDIRPSGAWVRSMSEPAENPMENFGGVEVTESEEDVTETVTKTCEEAVNFEIKTRIVLGYEKPERQERETELILYYPGYIQKVGRQNDEMAPLSYNQKDYQVDIERFRKYGCPHFDPVDAVTGQRHKIDCYRIKNFRLVEVTDKTYVPIGGGVQAVRHIKIAYKHDTYQGDEQGTERGWQFQTPDFSEILSKYGCTLLRDTCVDDVPRTFEELTVTKPCWEKELTYGCGKELNTCKDLQSKGCTLQSSACQDQTSYGCAVFSKTYACLETKKISRRTSLGKEAPFCMAGDCHTFERRKDQDFHEAVSKLSILEEAQKQLSPDGVTVFKGEAQTCTRDFASFRDCCGSCKGWGTSVGFKGCTAEEQTLGERRSKGLCRYIGQYCAKKLLGVCLQEKSVFCCFPSKLARIFHEKGRPQIGRGWGDAKCPDCGGFKVEEELKNIDWNKVDLSELFQDLFSKTDQKTEMSRTFTFEMPSMQERSKKYAEDTEPKERKHRDDIWA